MYKNEKICVPSPENRSAVRVATSSMSVKAVCILREDGNSGVNGVVTFTQEAGQSTHIHAEITGIERG